MEDEEHPIFVRAMSRSGGTLVCTLLDCHPDIAMSYELYPNLLEVEAEFDQIGLAEEIRKAATLKEARKLCPNARFGTYVARYGRGGLTHQDFADHITAIHEMGLHLSMAEGRFAMMKMAGVQKAQAEQKARWGMKFVGQYEKTLERWPEAKFINVLRDGRDVFASQKLVMKAEKVLEDVANGWCRNHNRFKVFSEKHPEAAFFLKYESLVNDPRTTLENLFSFLDLPWSDKVLNHEKQPLTIFGASHLSKARLEKPIDSSKIGRFRQDLSESEIADYQAIAGESLVKFGYEVD